MHSRHPPGPGLQPQGIVGQKLLPSIKPGVQRVPTNEIMIVNPTIRDLIVKGEDKKLPDAIRIGYQEGMVDFNENLRQLVERKDVSPGNGPGGGAEPRAVEDGAQGHQGGGAGYSVTASGGC